MGLRYLNGLTWAEVTREERVFCQHLYGLVVDRGAAWLVGHLNATVGTQLPLNANWELAYEACFYRDLWQLRGRNGDLFSPKRTFDLCLLADDHVVIIEAKAAMGFEVDQVRQFTRDRGEVAKETGAAVTLVALASSRCPVPAEILEAFDGPVLTWAGLAEAFGGDPMLQRADDVYEPSVARGWGASGRNNLSGKRSGAELMAAYDRGEELFVGRGGGLTGDRLGDDVATGGWRSQLYETNGEVEAPPGPNWFRLSELAALVRRSA